MAGIIKPTLFWRAFPEVIDKTRPGTRPVHIAPRSDKPILVEIFLQYDMPIAIQNILISRLEEESRLGNPNIIG
ncbi:MAG: hypothetical protein MJH11_17585, partial [Lentisphaeria bacterium]|nr:hypothetical protein [Lentisphaeria bacterium]